MLMKSLKASSMLRVLPFLQVAMVWKSMLVSTAWYVNFSLASRIIATMHGVKIKLCLREPSLKKCEKQLAMPSLVCDFRVMSLHRGLALHPIWQWNLLHSLQRVGSII